MSLCMCNGSIIIYSFSYHAPADTMTLVAGGKQQIFTSPNQPHLPNVPPPSFDLPQSSTAFFKPLWNLEKYPYLAFIPKNPTPSSSSLTARLATEPKKMPLCFDSGRWSLQPATITAWKSLEKNLVTATTGLFAFATKRYPGHDTALYPHRSKVPSNYSYDLAFVDKEELLATLESARRAFFIEMGRCSYALALTFDPKDPSARPRWPEFLHKEQRLEYAWLDMLQASPIAQFSTSNPRVGAIIHVAKCRWLEAIPVMVSLGIPFWLYWGSYPMLYIPQHSCVKSYAPALGPTSDLTPKTNVRLPGGLPSVEPGSGQLPGETWQAFFVRCAQDDEKRKAHENDHERQQREGRERASDPGKGPGKRGAKVWYWEEVDGFRVRTLLTRARVDDEWGLYSKVQKRFSGFRNEWDMCTEFDEDDLMGDADMDSDSEPILPIGPSKPRRADPSQSCSPPPSQPWPSDTFSKQQDSNIGSHNSFYSTPSESRNFARCAAIESDGSDSEPILPIGPSISRRADPSQSCSPPPQPWPSDAFSKQQDSNIGSHNSFYSTPSESRNFARCAAIESDGSDSEPTLPIGPFISRRADPSQSSRPPPSQPQPSNALLNQQDPNIGSHNLIRPAPSEPQNLGQGPAIERDGSDSEPILPMGRLRNSDGEPHSLSESGQDVLYAYSYHPLPATQRYFDDLAQLLYFCFGFNFGAGHYVVPASVNPVFRQWQEVIRCVGGQDLDSRERQRPIISYFLSLLFSSNAKTTKVDAISVILPEFWDLHPNNPEPLESKQRFLDIKLKYFGKDPAVCVLHARNLHPSRNTPWLVAVSPMIALEILRRDVGPHGADIAHFLISNGIPFNTLSPLPQIPPSTSPPSGPLPSLGIHPPGHVFTLADYGAYEAIRDSVLHRLPQARAALCKGGIITRLSRDVLDNSVVLASPSESARSGNQRKFICDGETYCDDHLTPEVMDLIAGTYQVQTLDKGRPGSLDFSLLFLYLT